MERGKLPEIPVPAWPQTATARLTNHPLSNREFLEVPYIVKPFNADTLKKKMSAVIRVRTHYSHQMTAAARAIAAMKFLMLRSKRVAIRRQSLRRQNMRSMMLRCL